MSALKRLRTDWDLAFLGLICVSAATVALLISPMDGYHHRTIPGTKPGVVRLECSSGNCWIRPQGSLKLFNLPLMESVQAYMGDEALTLGTGSGLVITFEDDKSELRLQNTGVIRISKGQQSVSAEQTDAGGGGANAALSAQVATANALIYVGEIPIKIVSPAAGTPILAAKFPVQVHLAFMVERYLPAEIAKLEEWSIVDLSHEQPQRVSTVKTGHTEPPVGGASFYGDFSVEKAGIYGLVPAGMDLAAANIQFRFEVKSTSDLENQISDLLQGVTANVDKQIEIRQ